MRSCVGGRGGGKGEGKKVALENADHGVNGREEANVCLLILT